MLSLDFITSYNSFVLFTFVLPYPIWVAIYDILSASYRNLRELLKIDAADYMMSICRKDALRELSCLGKKG